MLEMGMLRNSEERRGLRGKVQSSVASILRTGPGYPVHSIEKMALGVVTSLLDQLHNLWGPVQNENVGPLAQ